MTKPADDTAEVLRLMRERVEHATRDIDALVAELADQRGAREDLESLVDALLGSMSAMVVVVGHDGRVSAVSRGAADSLGGVDIVGKPIADAVPAEVAEVVAARLDVNHDVNDDGDAVGQDDAAAAISRLPSGAMVVVVSDR